MKPFEKSSCEDFKSHQNQRELSFIEQKCCHHMIDKYYFLRQSIPITNLSFTQYVVLIWLDASLSSYILTTNFIFLSTRLLRSPREYGCKFISFCSGVYHHATFEISGFHSSQECLFVKSREKKSGQTRVPLCKTSVQSVQEIWKSLGDRFHRPQAN